MSTEEEQQQYQNLENMIPSQLSPEQAMALQHFHALQGVLPAIQAGFPRPTVKRRKPVKWETWEEKNLIDGVRRFGRGNWAQIRAAFEFNPCRTNVDLHDKWRVLTGERKRARGNPKASEHAALLAATESAQRNAANQPVSPIPNQITEGETGPDGQKVQLVQLPGNSGYYLSSFLGYPSFNDSQIPAEMLQNMQNEFLAQQGIEISAAMESAFKEPQQQKKKGKKYKGGDEDEIAQELLKLSSAKENEENEDPQQQQQLLQMAEENAAMSAGQQQPEVSDKPAPKKRGRKSKAHLQQLAQQQLEQQQQQGEQDTTEHQ